MLNRPASVGARLPNFLVIGAAKCGTTSLAAYLAAHPQIHMARPKEVQFFTANWERGPEWYRSKFSEAPLGSALGEASPQYTQDPVLPNVPERIASVIPGARLVYLVRDPFAQLPSFHAHLVHKGKVGSRSFSKAVRQLPIYLATVRYGHQLSRYREHFEPGAILVLTAEQLLRDRENALRRVLSHIGVDPTVLPENLQEIRNTAADKLEVPSALAAPRAVWRALRGVTGRIPRQWRHTLRAKVSHPLPPDAMVIDREASAWLRDRLLPDLELLDSLTDPEFGEWSNHWSIRIR